MSSVHCLEVGQQEDGNEFEYTDAEIWEVTPTELVRWLNMRTFGITDPGPNTTIQPLVRENTLAFWKNEISLFPMPDCLQGWRSRSTKDGYPTKSAEMNDFIKRVKKLETRKEGAESQAQQPMQEIEFCRRLHEAFKLSNGTTNSSIFWKFGMLTSINFQFHLIARIDNWSWNIFVCLTTLKTLWKPIKLEQERPRQAQWAMADCHGKEYSPCFCMLISVGLWLELSLRLNPSAITSSPW